MTNDMKVKQDWSARAVWEVHYCSLCELCAIFFAIFAIKAFPPSEAASLAVPYVIRCMPHVTPVPIPSGKSTATPISFI
jgi:hypothetical protein